jgi:sulfopyruvate decarboxylase subunit alpha
LPGNQKVAIVGNMTPTEGLYSALRSGDVNFFLSVPCKLLADLIAKVETDSDVIYTPVTREEEGVGLACGAHLAGRNPALIMQNSGFGNCANAILSLLNYYRIPVVFIVSHRGSSGEPIEAQRMMGAAVTDLLRVLGVEVLNVPKPEMVSLVQPAIEQARQARRSLAILLPFSFWNAN